MGSACSSPAAHLAQSEARELAREIGILRDDHEQLDMRSLIMLMWRARAHPRLVEILSNLVETHADERHVFDGIEFYLPQIVHMILHLELKWKTSFLEQFALLISQQSLHLALQMYWILVASMQDYQPEDDEGRKNPTANAELFVRCVQLQNSLEKAVVFGSPNCAELERQYAQGKLSKARLQELELKDRLDAAAAFIKESKQQAKYAMEGHLLYKRWNRTSRFATKGWSKQHFRIQDRILISSTAATGGKMLRTLPLAHIEVVVVPRDKYEHYFEVREQNRDRVWKMRASSAEEMNKWIAVLKAEALAPPLPVSASQKQLTESQIARYGFYRSERDFVRALTDICEDLRFVAIPSRKPALRAHLEKLEIPGCVYLPMSKSTAKWARVVSVVVDKGHPFSTRARCPSLMTFEIQGDGDVDLANYLYQTLDQSVESSEGRRGFIRSAKLSALQQQKSSSSADASASRMQVAFSDAGDSSPNLSAAAAAAANDFSIWADEVAPGSKTKALLGEERIKKHEDLGNQALEFLKSVIPDFTPPAPANNNGGGITSTANAISKAAEEDRTMSMRITSIKGKAAVPSGEPQYGRIIAKSNDDLRQEVFTMQLMQFHKDVWDELGLPLYLRTYRILSTSKNTGLLEVITNADSIDGIKKKLMEKNPADARFINKFKELYPDPEEFKQCQRRYMESLAGSSLVSYILRTGDRHNGNIMVENSGRLAHIDFGFVFGMRPGKDKIPYTDFSFERAPFKLTNEMVEVMGGKGSPLWKEFIKLLVDGFLAIRAKAQVLITLVEITGYNSMFPCFRQPGGGGKRVIRELKQRLMLNVPDKQIPKRVEALADSSLQHFGTILYEKFQLRSNGIAPIY